MAGETSEFPDGDAWADHMPDVRGGFSTSSVRKQPLPAVTAPESTSNDEYKTFASLDLTNIGR